MFVKSFFKVVLAVALLGDFSTSAYDEPEWWPLMQSTFDGINLKRCFKRNEFVKSSAPPNGKMCSENIKTCFFDDQVCNGKPYPLTRCFCDGRTWQCETVACPNKVSFPTPSETEASDLATNQAPTQALTEDPVPVPTQGPATAPKQGPALAPTQAPVTAPTQAPVPAPTQGPVTAPTQASVSAPTQGPVTAPTQAPVPAPTQAPVPPPTQDPVPVPTQAPVLTPSQAPVPALSQVPEPNLIQAPIPAPSQAPIPPPSQAPVPTLSQAPIPTPTQGPVFVPSQAPAPAPTQAPVTAPTQAPKPNPTQAPVDIVSVKPSGPPTTGAPITIAPVVAPAIAPAESSITAPVPSPTQVPRPTPTDGSAQPTIPSCPSLEAIMADPNRSCTSGLECFYDFSETRGDERCFITKTCNCESSRFECTDSIVCVSAPTCPAELDVLRADPSCSAPGFGCTYTYSEEDGDQICDISEACTCGETGAYECAVQSRECKSAPVCPATSDVIEADPTCTALGFVCFFSSLEPVGDELCVIFEACECLDNFQYDCKSESTCVTGPTCPSEPTPNAICNVEGFSCTYERVSPSIDGSQICTTIDTCVCGASNYECSPTVTCENIDIQDCPATKAALDADPSCTAEGLGCGYTNVDTVDGLLCTSTDLCTCDGTGFSCVPDGEPDCAEGPTCPTFMVFQQDMSCSSEGLGCTFTYSNNTDTELCTVIETCQCSAAGQFECSMEQSCMPVPTCPEFSVLQEDKTCDSADVKCIYNYSNNTGSQTCAVNETCTCGQDSLFSCTIEVGTCTDNAPTLPPVSCPSFETFLEDPLDCPREGLTCTYASTSTASDGSVCERTDICPCTASLQFDCNTTEVGDGCAPAPAV